MGDDLDGKRTTKEIREDGLQEGLERIQKDKRLEEGSRSKRWNVGDEEMKVVCFFAPPTGLDNYRLYEGVEFAEKDSFKR